MDGKGRFLDNIFIERLWRSLKYEDVFIKAYGSVAEARQGIGGWLRFYNKERLHQALGYRTPRAVFDGEAHEFVDNASALKGYGVAYRLVGRESKKGVDLCRVRSILNYYFVPRIGREREAQRDSLLGHLGSCPADGIHLIPSYVLRHGPAAAEFANDDVPIRSDQLQDYAPPHPILQPVATEPECTPPTFWTVSGVGAALILPHVNTYAMNLHLAEISNCARRTCRDHARRRRLASER